MKRIIFAAFLAACSLLSACSQLTQFSISEQEINQSLAKHDQFSRNIGLPGVAQAHITLNNLSSAIGREEPDKITLNGDADLNFQSLFGNQQATIQLKLKAKPVFDRTQGAIYLQEMQIVDAKIQPEKMQTILQTLMPYLNQSLRTWFNQQPAYILSTNRSEIESLAKKHAKGIEVKPGEIIIPFTGK